MGREREPGGRKWRGPFTYDHLRQAVELKGFVKCGGVATGTKHDAWEHPQGDPEPEVDRSAQGIDRAGKEPKWTRRLARLEEQEKSR